MTKQDSSNEARPLWTDRQAHPYQPIRDYALVGDCHGAALIAHDGSIDWCCLGRFDAEPVLWRLLDAQRGAFFQVAPVETARVSRAYVRGTNILRTTFATMDGHVSLTDFMPVGRASEAEADDFVTLNAPGWLVRIVEGVQGTVQLRARFVPAAIKFDGEAPQGATGSRRSDPTALLFCDGGLGTDDALDEIFAVNAGERRVFVLAPAAHQHRAPATHAERLREITETFWREWLGRCRYDGPYNESVHRSILALKLLTYAPTGAIVAAPTTSLPEEPGGVRNWDYRCSWLRDSAFVLHALAALGYHREARDFCEFQRLCCLRTLPSLQILYGIGGETELPERNLEHLDGYLQSRPVRVGNAAYQQRQMDIYGEILDWALVYWELGGATDETQQAMIGGIADHVMAHWQEPDQGLWEMRGEPRHHVFSKLMAWVALDRAIRMLGGKPHWMAARDAILEAVLDQGVDREGGHLVQAFGYPAMDASLLLVPLLEIPIERSVLVRTVQAVERELREGDYVRRYRTADGLPGGEGAFLICSFWLVDALLFVGRDADAQTLFERLLDKRNAQGLYAEEIDPETGAFLGNFPQAFTHLALVNSAIHLQLHERGGAAALAGTHADRARRTAESLQAARVSGSLAQ